MQNVLLVLILLTVIAGFIILGIMEWQRIKDNSTKFQIQMQMAEAQASMTNPLKFDDVKKIVTDIIINLCIVEVVNNGYGSKTEAELSIIFEDVLTKIAAKTESYLSKEIIRQWEKFATEEYRTEFIIFTTKTAFLTQLTQSHQRLGNPVERSLKKPIPTKKAQGSDKK